MRRHLFALLACPLAVGALAVFPGTSLASSNKAAAAVASKDIARYLKVQTTLGGLTQKLKRIPKGKTIDYFGSSLPISQEFDAGIGAAAKAIGMKLTTINAGFTPQTISSAFSQAFQAPPAAILLLGTPASEITPQLQEAQAKHIPVITLFTSPSTYWAANIFSNTQFARLGRLEADFVIAKSAAKANVAVFYEPELPGAAGTTAFIQSTFKSGCPSCVVGTQKLPLSGVASTDPAAVVSYLQAHPSVNWLLLEDAEDAVGVPAALAQAGIHGVKILTGGGNSVNYAYIKAGQQTADASQSPYFMGWALVNATAQVLTHQAVQVGFIPLQFITASAITWNIKNPWPAVPGYPKLFEKLWGVK